MATETDNKEGISGSNADTNAGPVAKVGDGGKTPRRLKLPETRNPLSFIRNKKRAVLYTLLIAIVLIGGGMLIKQAFHIGEKVYAQAAGHKIYKQDIQDLIGKNRGISDHEAAQVLADQYLIQAIIKDKDITVTDQELVAKYGKVTEEQKKSDKYAYQNKQNQLYFSQLDYYNHGIYKGMFLIANFSRHLEFDPALPEDKIHDPELGNPAAIARDKKYAKGLITKLYDEIRSGKITFDQAIQIEHKDPQVGEKAYVSLTHSGSFDTSRNGPLGVFNTESVRRKINGIKQGSMTKPFAVSVNLSVDGTGDKTADSYYLVVRMDRSTGSYTGLSFAQYIAKEKEKYGYRVYV